MTSVRHTAVHSRGGEGGAEGGEGGEGGCGGGEGGGGEGGGEGGGGVGGGDGGGGDGGGDGGGGDGGGDGGGGDGGGCGGGIGFCALTAAKATNRSAARMTMTRCNFLGGRTCTGSDALRTYQAACKAGCKFGAREDVKKCRGTY